MKLSLKTIAMCQMKYGRGRFCGFENIDATILDDISKFELQSIMLELMENEIVEYKDECFQLSPYGLFLCRMMHTPEQYLIIDNKLTEICVRIYVYNAFYLCVVEDKAGGVFLHENNYIVKLLPKIELVVGSFAYAIQYGKKEMAKSSDIGLNTISIVGVANRRDLDILSTFSFNGTFAENTINGAFSFEPFFSEKDKQQQTFCGDECELTNLITKWMLDNSFVSVA